MATDISLQVLKDDYRAAHAAFFKGEAYWRKPGDSIHDDAMLRLNMARWALFQASRFDLWMYSHENSLGNLECFNLSWEAMNLIVNNPLRLVHRPNPSGASFIFYYSKPSRQHKFGYVLGKATRIGWDKDNL